MSPSFTSDLIRSGAGTPDPAAEPEERAALLDRIMDAELPRFAEALERLGES